MTDRDQAKALAPDGATHYMTWLSFGGNSEFEFYKLTNDYLYCLWFGSWIALREGHLWSDSFRSLD